MNTAEVILHNGKIATVNPKQPEAQAVWRAGKRAQLGQDRFKLGFGLEPVHKSARS